MRWSGYAVAPTTGWITLLWETDGAGTLAVDGRTVLAKIDSDPSSQSVQFFAAAGDHYEVSALNKTRRA